MPTIRSFCLVDKLRQLRNRDLLERDSVVPGVCSDLVHPVGEGYIHHFFLAPEAEECMAPGIYDLLDPPRPSVQHQKAHP